jgi:hypothetical protein
MSERLSQKLARQQTADPSFAHRCFGTHFMRSENRDLSVRLLQGHSLLLPWSRYVRIWHYKDEPVERLVLVFSGTEIVVIGSHLSPIMEAIEEGRLAWIRELPEDYRAFQKPGETFVERLEVNEAKEDEAHTPLDEEANDGPLPALGPRIKL